MLKKLYNGQIQVNGSGGVAKIISCLEEQISLLKEAKVHYGEQIKELRSIYNCDGNKNDSSLQRELKSTNENFSQLKQEVEILKQQNTEMKKDLEFKTDQL